MSKFSKIILCSITMFVVSFGLIFPFLSSSVIANAQVVSDDSIVDTSNSTFYNEYYLLEYISSTGTQYINTGFNPSSNSEIYATYYTTSAPSSAYGVFFGTRTLVDDYYINTCTFNDYFSNSFLNKALRFGRTAETLSINSSNLGKKATLYFSSNSCTFTTDSSISISFTTTPFTSSLPIFIFALNNNGFASDFSSMRLYSFKIYDNSVLVRDFVPAQRKTDSAIGVYDLVNNKFYSSASGSSFLAGPKIYTVDFYNGNSLYNTQSFTSFNDFILPSNPSVSAGSTFVGWSLTNDNNIDSVINPSAYINSSSDFPLTFYSVVVSDDFLAGYDYAKNIFDGYGPFLYSNYAFVKGNSIDSFDVIPSLTGRVSYPDFVGYGGGVVLSDSLWSRVDSYEYNNEIDTSLVFTFDTPVPVAKYTNFMFNGNFQFGNSAVFYFNDGTSYTFSSDMGSGNFVDLTSYNSKFISRIRLTYASSIGDYGQGIGLASNPSYLDSYNNGYTEGKEFGYNNGYSTGYREGNNTGYNKGYNEGLANGSDYSFFGLFSAVFDAPIATLTGLLNFELFGVNLLGLFLGLLTLAVILLVLRLIRGGK